MIVRVPECKTCPFKHSAIPRRIDADFECRHPVYAISGCYPYIINDVPISQHCPLKKEQVIVIFLQPKIEDIIPPISVIHCENQCLRPDAQDFLKDKQCFRRTIFYSDRETYSCDYRYKDGGLNDKIARQIK
jgi:hypothetical protein